MRFGRTISAIALGALISALCACSGGTALSPAVPQRANVRQAPAAHKTVGVKMRIVIRGIPKRGTFARRLLRGGRTNPFYTASSTQGIDVQVSQGASGVLAETQTNISAGSANCVANGDASRTCTFVVPAPPGNDTFTIATYDGPPVNGGGFGNANQLGYAVFSKTVIAGTDNVFPNITLSGIVSSLSLNAPIAQIHGTLPSVQALGLFALDADGNVILDSQYYDANAHPITISLSLGTPTGPKGGGGNFTLSATSFPSPPVSAVQLSYDGTAVLAPGLKTGAFSTTIVAKANGGTSAIAPARATVSLIGPTVQTFEFTNKAPDQIVLGPDGNMWFTDGLGAIDSITPAGVVTVHNIPTAGAAPYGLTVGPDGNIWFTELEPGNIGWVTPGDAGPAHECPNTKTNRSPLYRQGPFYLVSGPPQSPNLYVYTSNEIAELTTGCNLVKTFSIAVPSSSFGGIAVSPAGDLWYSSGSNIVTAITPNGAKVLSVTVPNVDPVCHNAPLPGQLAFDPNGNAWVSNQCAAAVAKFTPSGAVTMVPVAEGNYVTVYGPDGNVWVGGENNIERVTPAGAYRDYGGGDGGEYLGAAVGPDGDIWFAAGGDGGSIQRFVW